jgi:hypothetical protein
MACFYARDQLPDLRAIVMWGEEPWQEGVLSWKELLRIGDSGTVPNPGKKECSHGRNYSEQETQVQYQTLARRSALMEGITPNRRLRYSTKLWQEGVLSWKELLRIGDSGTVPNPGKKECSLEWNYSE